MGSTRWTAKIVPTTMVAGIISLLLSLWLGGFIVYQWVLASEATAASVLLFIFVVRNYAMGRKSKWPPLLPLALIAASGGAKSFYVATGKDTPVFVIVILLLGVLWFTFSSWRIWRANRHALG